MTEEELRCLTSKNNEVYAVYDGKIVSPAAILEEPRDCSRIGQVDWRREEEEPMEDESDSKWPEWIYFIRS